jgi:hypothetical protein
MLNVHRSLHDDDGSSTGEGMPVIEYFAALMSTLEDKMTMDIPVD